MPFKPIDLQVSVPRTPEVGGIQSHANHKAIVEQTKLAEHESKQTELMRGKNTGVEHSTGLNIRQEQERKQSSSSNNKKRKGQDETLNQADEGQPPEHPFKGHHFDISL